MFLHQIKIAFRNINKRKIYALINLFGLAVGLTISLLILNFIKHENSFDAMHQSSEQIYRLTWEDKGAGVRFATFQNPMAPLIADALPEISAATRFWMREVLLTLNGNSQYEQLSLIEDNYFEMFNYGVVAGDPVLAIQDLNSAVLTVAAARQFFGDDNPIGRSFTVNNAFEFRVAAIIENNLSNSHLVGNIFVNLNNTQRILNNATILDQVRSDILYQYVRIPALIDLEALSLKTESYIKENVDPVYDRRVIYQPLRDIHFTTDLQNEISSIDEALGLNKPLRNRSDMVIFSVAALLTLTIATINFVNLQIVQGYRRVREYGICQIIGTTRAGIGKQVLLETVLMSYLSMIFAVTIYQAVTPLFASTVAMPTEPFSLQNPLNLGFLVLMPLILGLLAGIYPAIVIARIKPVWALKGDIVKAVSSSHFRSALVVFQFSTSIGLIIAAGVINSQIQFAFSKPLGFDPENIVLVSMNSNEARSAYSNMLDQLSIEPGIISVTVASNVPTQSLGEGALLTKIGSGDNTEYSTRRVNAGTGYFETLGISIVAGREFNPDIQSDRLVRSSENEPFQAGLILNQTAAREMGWLDPEDAIGQLVRGNLPGAVFDGTIIGIANDVHYQSIRTEIEAVAYIYVATRGTMAVKIDPGNRAGALESIDNVWQQNVPNYQIQRRFLQDEYLSLYANENRTFDLFLFLSSTAILIACLGLFALASFITERRIKEIGIRKVLGATVASIAIMLSWGFSRLVIASNLIAWPAAWWIMQGWLGGFSYRTDIELPIFLFAGVVTLLVAALSTFQRVYSVAARNPILQVD